MSNAKLKAFLKPFTQKVISTIGTLLCRFFGGSGVLGCVHVSLQDLIARKTGLLRPTMTCKTNKKNHTAYSGLPLWSPKFGKHGSFKLFWHQKSKQLA
jgi:hypothetical protein